MRLAHREGRTDVTAHVYGNNVPAIIAYTLSIMLPVYLETHDANRAWEIGAAAVAWTGIIKLAAAPFAALFRRFIPQPASMTVFGAAMYSYLALVLLQRVFDQPLVGLIALAIIFSTVLANIPITRWRIPPFLAAWIVPLSVALAIGYVHPTWSGVSLQLPFSTTPEPLRAMGLALPYLSVIAPIAIYQMLQDIASVAGAAAAGDDYDVRAVLACDGLGTLVAGLAGSVITPVIYAMHPPYKAVGARISFALWTPIAVLAIVIERTHPLRRAIVSLADSSRDHRLCLHRRRHGDAASRGSKYLGAVLLGFVLPAGAVVATALNSALPALKLSAANPVVQGRAQPLHLLVIGPRARQRIPVPGLGSGRGDLRNDRPALRPRGTCGASSPPFSPGLG